MGKKLKKMTGFLCLLAFAVSAAGCGGSSADDYVYVEDHAGDDYE